MTDKNVSGGEMTPSEMPRPHAEIIFLAIAPAEQIFREQAGFRQAVAPDIHAKTDGSRQFDAVFGIDAARQTVKSRHILFVWNGAPPGLFIGRGIAAEACVI